MEEVSEKCRLCLKVVFNEKVSLFDTSIGFSYAEVLLQDLCLEVVITVLSYINNSFNKEFYCIFIRYPTLLNGPLMYAWNVLI